MAALRAARAADADALVSLWAALLEHHRQLDPHWRAAPGAEATWRSFVLQMLDDPDASLLVWDEAQAGGAGSGSGGAGSGSGVIGSGSGVIGSGSGVIGSGSGVIGSGSGVVGSGSGVVGFCAAQIRRAPPVLTETGRCEISDIYVRDEARRRGIAAELVRATLDWCAERGVQRVEVRVATHNSAAQGFWRAAGFVDFVDVLQRHL